MYLEFSRHYFAPTKFHTVHRGLIGHFEVVFYKISLDIAHMTAHFVQSTKYQKLQKTNSFLTDLKWFKRTSCRKS